MTRLDEIIEVFASVDEATRLELLLDYAQRLPALPARLQAQRDQGFNRVEECQTPVFLWIESDGSKVRLYVDVAEEAPTIRGLVSILVHALDGATPQQVQELPGDLLVRLGLSGVIRMNRAVGLAAMISRIRQGGGSKNDDLPELNESLPCTGVCHDATNLAPQPASAVFRTGAVTGGTAS